MVLTFDFSGLPPRLDQPVKGLKDLNNDPFLPMTETRTWNSDIPLEHCLRDMYKRNIPLCLVRDISSTKGGTSETSFGGCQASACGQDTVGLRVMDMRDIVYTLLEHLEHGLETTSEEEGVASHCSLPVVHNVLVTEPGSAQESRSHQSSLWEHCKDSFLPLLKSPVGRVANISQRNRFVCIPHSASLRTVLQCFEEPQWIILYADDGAEGSDEGYIPDKIRGVFTLTNFMQLLERLTPPDLVLSPQGPLFVPPGTDPLKALTRKPTLTPFDGWTAGMIKAATESNARPRSSEHSPSEIHVCFEDESLLSALKLLHVTGFSAVPIVSRAKLRVCRGVLSGRDLQCILLGELFFGVTGTAVFNVAVLDYLSKVRQLEALKAKYPVIHVAENATLDTVLAKILASNIRRLFLTDNAGYITGVLTVTDLGRFIARQFVRDKPSTTNVSNHPSAGSLPL